MIAVMLVDDHPVVRTGMRGMLEGVVDLQIVGEAENGVEAVELAESAMPDVILMDLRMPGLNGVGAIERILLARPETRILVVTTFSDDIDILRAVEAGAAGYLLKDASHADLVDAIRAAAHGETVLTPSIADRLALHTRRAAEKSAQGPALSTREVEVLEYVAKGRTNAEIGRALQISEATVKTHLLHTYAKLKASDRTSAVIAALGRGLLRDIL